MLKYYFGFSGLVALAVGCVVCVYILVTLRDPGDQGIQPLPSPSRQAHAETPSVMSDSARPAEDHAQGSLAVPSNAARGRVVDHVDGDTLRIVAVGATTWMQSGEETTVRLLEIDTPESVDPNSPEQCYAERASQALEDKLPLGSDVWVQADRDLLDPYGRTLLYLWTIDGSSVNLAMVREGYAKAVLFEPNDMYIRQMRRAEAQARLAQRGLWSACGYFGQPLSLTGGIASSPGRSKLARPDATADPRFPYCSDANDAGYGDYVAGRDPEYDWYDDVDADGIVCER